MATRKKEPLAPPPGSLRRLHRLLVELQSDDPLSYYRFGQQLQKSYPERRQNYRQHQMKDLAARLGLEDKSAEILLWCARKFAAEYTEQEAERLCRDAAEAGTSLSWSHVRALLAVQDRRLRRAMEKQCVENRWTTRQLRRKIQEKKGFPPEGGGRIDRPGTLDEAVQQFMQESRAWLRRCRKVWFGEPDATTADKPPVFKAKPKIEDRQKIVDLIDKAITDADTVRQWAIRAKRELEQLRTSVATKTRR